MSEIDELRAEVERLKRELDDAWRRNRRLSEDVCDLRVAAYRRGAEAMREAAVQYLRTKGWFMNQQVACSISVLPLPEEKL